MILCSLMLCSVACSVGAMEKEVFGKHYSGLAVNWQKTEKEGLNTVAETVGIAKMGDAAILERLHEADSLTAALAISITAIRIEPTFVCNMLGSVGHVLSLCLHEPEKGAQYCVSEFPWSVYVPCSGKKGNQLCTPVQAERALCMSNEGRYAATVAPDPKGSLIVMYDIARYQDEIPVVAEIRIGQENAQVDCCFLGERTLMFRAGQKVYTLFIAQSPTQQKKVLSESFSFNWKLPAAFDKKSSLVIPVDTDRALAAIRSPDSEGSVSFHVLRRGGYGVWQDIATLQPEKQANVLRKAHPRGVYITIDRPAEEMGSEIASKTLVYDLTKQPPTFCALELGAITAFDFSSSGKSVVFATMPSEWNGDANVVVYSLENPAMPECSFSCAAKDCGIIQRLIWPQWGPGIIAIAREGNVVKCEEKSGWRSFLAAYHALRNRDSLLKGP